MALKKVMISVDEETKNEAQEVFDALGLTFSGAIDIYLKAVARCQGIPFELSLRPQSGITYSVVPFPTDDDVS